MIGLRSKRIISDVVIYLVLLIMIVIWLFPLVWMIARAFGTEAGNTSSIVFPEAFTFDHFRNLFPGGPGYVDRQGNLVNDYIGQPYLKWVLNTFIVAIGSCVISTLFVLMVSYALSRLRFNMRKKLMNIALILGLFPGFLSMIALYFLFQFFNLTPNNLLGLMFAYSLGAGTGYYIVKGFFDTVPIAIDEAARIDGASKNRIFWQMIIPLSKPIIIYTILTNFISPWCDYVLASVFLSEAKYYTVAVGIRYWISGLTLPATHFARFCAGGVLVSVPIVILFLIMQRFYVAGITGGAAKG